MNIKTYQPTQWDAHVSRSLQEPFPWAHPNYHKTFHPFYHPLGVVFLGVEIMLIGNLIGAVSLVSWSQSGVVATLLTALGSIVLAAVIGGSIVFVGAVRLKWMKFFVKIMGFSPFDRKP